ncbi:dihydrodipicolinate synthase family protein [Ktedonobacter sp. SOSP1-85]|uniref:dihydrodipicolinate synthase family protein n=1 Tax=Ktedonobacter sp. SOSP1-85 TaxID=2778367 RepID=UPI001915282E|nr:dihydrodipicolinate synthase family protein [Ktedonobacter sp. SOSP1-85]GHO74085.1 dihydrodipicolinate synthase family protein [Ktedonobacter sp. SOSP1-85]
MQTLLPNGVYPPLPTFFDTQENLDLFTLQRHMRALQESGIAGYVLLGSNGEAAHVTSEERAQLVSTAREMMDESTDTLPLIVGCGDQATRTTIAHCQLAAHSGATIALVLPPFYFRSRMDSQALQKHYRAVADASPIPILLYNMPANTAGLDMDVSLICQLAEHPNIIGLKDSSGNVAKMASIVAQAPADFSVFAGSASFLLPSLAIGAAGTIAALANIFPHEVCLVQALFEAGQLEEARALQARLIPANTAVTTTYGVPGLKAALEILNGYGGRPRMPLQSLSTPEREQLSRLLATTPMDAAHV